MILSSIASLIVYYNFPAFARKSFYIGVGVVIPLFCLWIAVGVPGTSGEWWVALFFYTLAAVIVFFSHRDLAHQLAHRFRLMLRSDIKQNT